MFWVCWIGELIIAGFFVMLLARLYAAGTVQQHDAGEIKNYWLMMCGTIVLLVASALLYYNGWFKIATVLAAFPVAILAVTFLIPIIAYLAGERMN